MKKTILAIMSFGLITAAAASPLAVPPIKINGLPAAVTHNTVTTIDLAQLHDFPAAWNITCDYQTTSSTPVAFQLSEQYWASYSPEVYVDDKDIGGGAVMGGDYNGFTPTQLTKQQGIIKFTDVYAYMFNDPVWLKFKNVDPDADVTITNCVATYSRA